MAETKKPSAKKPAAKKAASSTTSADTAAASTEAPEMITLDKDIFNNSYLPGQEVTVIKELYNDAHAYESAKVDLEKATKEITKAKKKLEGSARKYRKEFTATRDGLHFIYPCAGVDIFIDRTEKLSTSPQTSKKAQDKKKSNDKSDKKGAKKAPDTY